VSGLSEVFLGLTGGIDWFCRNSSFLSVSISHTMESENGVSLENESCVIVKNYEEESVGNSEVPIMNGISEPANKAQGFNSSEVVVKASATVATSKNSKSIKVLHK
jgi:hypothetical protein